MATWFVLVLVVVMASPRNNTIVIGRYETRADCQRAAAVIDASTPLKLELFCKKLA